MRLVILSRFSILGLFLGFVFMIGSASANECRRLGRQLLVLQKTEVLERLRIAHNQLLPQELGAKDLYLDIRALVAIGVMGKQVEVGFDAALKILAESRRGVARWYALNSTPGTVYSEPDVVVKMDRESSLSENLITVSEGNVAMVREIRALTDAFIHNLDHIQGPQFERRRENAEKAAYLGLIGYLKDGRAEEAEALLMRGVLPLTAPEAGSAEAMLLHDLSMGASLAYLKPLQTSE